MDTPSPAAEAVIEPDLPIVDPHHHLWDYRAMARTLGPETHPFERIVRRSPLYLLDELVTDIRGGGHDVRATVFVECGAMYRADGPDALKPVGETEFVNGVAAMSASGLHGPIRACAGIVGHADLRRGDAVAEVLEAHLAAGGGAAGGGRFRGIRHSVSWDADPGVLGPLARMPQGLLVSDAFRAGFARLAPLGLSFDAWLLEPQLPELIDLARAFPETAIMLDHVGTPLGIGAYAGRREERFGLWRERIRALAQCPAVMVKLGGLAMPFGGFDGEEGEGAEPQSARLARLWAPYIETCIEAFGVERCLFESNFPVDLFTCSYTVLWNGLKRIAAGYSTDEKAALFSGSAARFYRLAQVAA